MLHYCNINITLHRLFWTFEAFVWYLNSTHEQDELILRGRRATNDLSGDLGQRPRSPQLLSMPYVLALRVMLMQRRLREQLRPYITASITAMGPLDAHCTVYGSAVAPSCGHVTLTFLVNCILLGQTVSSLQSAATVLNSFDNSNLQYVLTVQII